MCGRYASSKDPAELVEEFGVTRPPATTIPADYNVAPTKHVYAVLQRSYDDLPGQQRLLADVVWGLVPSWAKDRSIGHRLVNARVETAAEKPSFRRALDARRCLAYLTIEHKGTIPREFRAALGNRVFGCDDCLAVCPWNKFAQRSPLADFDPREGLSGQQLLDLFAWTEAQFLQRTEGSPIRRIGHERSQRNIAVALGNAPNSPEIQAALGSRANHPSPLVREHVTWALARLAATSSAPAPRA